MRIRNKNENQNFIEHLESAVDKAEQAIDNITYTFYPQMNKRTIEKLKKAINILEEVQEMCIFKP